MLLRPTLNRDNRGKLSQMAEFPLSVWRRRMAGILATKDSNQRGRDVLDATEEQVQELMAQLQEPVPITVAVAPPKAPAPVKTPAKAPRGKGPQVTPARQPKARKPGRTKTK